MNHAHSCGSFVLATLSSSNVLSVQPLISPSFIFRSFIDGDSILLSLSLFCFLSGLTGSLFEKCSILMFYEWPCGLIHPVGFKLVMLTCFFLPFCDGLLSNVKLEFRSSSYFSLLYILLLLLFDRFNWSRSRLLVSWSGCSVLSKFEISILTWPWALADLTSTLWFNGWKRLLVCGNV